MIRQNKILLLGTLGVALFAVILLASSIAQLKFEPGTLSEPDTIIELRSLLSQIGRFFRDVIMILIIAAPIVYILWSAMAKPKARRVPEKKSGGTLGMLIKVITWILALIVIKRQLQEGQFRLDLPQPEEIAPNITDVPEVVRTVNFPDWLSFAASLALTALLIWIGWKIWRSFQKPTGSLKMLSIDAQMAIDELRSGGDFRNVILRCYYDMEQTLQENRNIHRKVGMTPREFERRLSGYGLPEDAVFGLTRLFEAARYGGKELDHSAENEAIEYLSLIVRMSERKTV